MADTSEEAKPAANQPRSETELAADPRIQALLAAYAPTLHSLFLSNYAKLLDDLHRNGQRYENDMEYLLHRYDKAAYESLWLIQRQKLFDLECRWRAGQVAVPEARLTGDFQDWQEYIEECRVLPPISPEELAALDAFLVQLTDPEDIDTGNLSRTFWHQRRYSE